MFYQTQLSKIDVGGAVDVQGKYLHFIGNLPVVEGDKVWTDGNVIFGHIPRKSSSIIPVNGGVPCSFNSFPLNGYFEKSGAFKNYNIATNKESPNWIVNGNYKYFHSSKPVFDAEISKKDSVETGLLTAELDGLNGGNNGFYFIKNNEVLDDDFVVIKEDNLEIGRVYLHDYIDAIEKVRLLSLEGPVESTNISGHSQLLNFHLNQDGTWDALIASFAEGKINYQPWYDYASNVYPMFIMTDSGVGDKLIDLKGDNPGKELKDTLDGLGVEVPSGFTDITETSDPESLAEAIASLYAQFSEPRYIIVHWIDYGELVSIAPPRNQVSTYRRVCTYYLVHVKSDGVKEILHEDVQASRVAVLSDERIEVQAADQTDGLPLGKEVTVSLTTMLLGTLKEETVDTIHYYKYTRSQDVVFRADAIDLKNYKSSWRYPAQDGYSVEMDEWKLLKIYDPDGKIISQPDLSFFRQYLPFRITVKPIDGQYTAIYTSEDRTRKVIAGSYKPTFGYFYLYKTDAEEPIGNNYTPLAERYGNYYWDYVYGESLAQCAAVRIPSLSITALNTGYLINFQNDMLYQIDLNGEISPYSTKSPLHNFRLRYLKTISKARI